MVSDMLLLVRLTQGYLGDQRGEKEQSVDRKDDETTKEFKTQDSISLEEAEQDKSESESQSETRVKSPMNMIGKYYM